MNTLQAAVVTALSFILLLALAVQGPIVYSELENRARAEFHFVREWLAASKIFERHTLVSKVREIGNSTPSVHYENLSTEPEKLLQFIDFCRDMAHYYEAQND